MIKIRSNRHLSIILVSAIVLIVASIISSSSNKISAAVCTWSGADDEFWSTATNWDCGGLSDGDELVFPLGAANTDTVNDLPDNTTFNAISVGWNSYTFTGAPIYLRGDLVFDDDDSSGILDFDLNFEIVFDYLNVRVVDEGTSLYLNGNISGAEDFYKQGLGFVYLTGTNSFSGGSTIQEGVVVVTTSSSLGLTALRVSSGSSLYMDGSLGNITLDLTSLILEGAGYAADGRGVLASISGNNIINAPVTLDFDSTIWVDTQSLELTGVVSGTWSLIKEESGVLILSGSQGNTYIGDTYVNNGTLRLNKSSGVAVPSSTIIIGDGVGLAESAIFMLFGSDQFNANTAMDVYADGIYSTDNSAITNNISDLFIHDNGRVNLSGSSDITTTLTIEGGFLRTYSGNVSISASSIDCLSTVDRNSTIEGDPFTFTGDVVINTTTDWGFKCDITSVIQGSGQISIVGNGIQFAGNNTFTGALLIGNEARLIATNSGALGNGSTGTTVAAGGVLSLSNNITIASEPLTIGGVGNNFNGPLNSESGSNTYSGSITLQGADNTYITILGDAVLTITSAIGGSIDGSLVFQKFNPGEGYIQIGGANTFTASSIEFGDVLVRKNASVNIFPDTLNVHLNQYSTFDLNSFSETLGSLTGEVGSAVTLGNGTLSVGAANSDASFGGVISGIGSVTKVGTGTQTFTGNNSYNGSTNINAGNLIVNGQQASSGVNLSSTGILGGTGRVGVIVGGGTGGIAPGLSPGVLNVTGNVAFASTNNFNVEINGATLGSQYDQLNVDGSINLNNATLNVTLGFTPTSGNTFTIVQSTGVLIGTFNGLPNGSTFTVGGNTLRIDYGTNSVVISVSTGGGNGGNGGSNGNGNGGGLAETGVSIPLMALSFLVSTTAVVVFANKYTNKRRRLKKNFR